MKKLKVSVALILVFVLTAMFTIGCGQQKTTMSECKVIAFQEEKNG